MIVETVNPKELKIDDNNGKGDDGATETMEIIQNVSSLSIPLMDLSLASVFSHQSHLFHSQFYLLIEPLHSSWLFISHRDK